MKNVFKGMFSKEVKKLNEDMDKIFSMGKVQGRMEMVNELIDLHDGGTDFLEALREVQAKNGTMVDNLKNKSM